jgi:hypothetical protein
VKDCFVSNVGDELMARFGHSAIVPRLQTLRRWQSGRFSAH